MHNPVIDSAFMLLILAVLMWGMLGGVATMCGYGTWYVTFTKKLITGPLKRFGNKYRTQVIWFIVGALFVIVLSALFTTRSQ